MKSIQKLRAAILSLSFLAVMTFPAFAQTSANFTYGYVPTVAEWNALFASKQDYLGAPPLLVTGGTMTGPLVTSASSASGSGFNLPPGAAPTSPNNGDIWVTSGGIFARINGSTMGPLLASGSSSSTLSNLTVTGSFTATGLVTNSDLVNQSTTVNGVTCTLGSACTIVASATGVQVGVTSVTSGTSGFILSINSGVLGAVSPTGTGSVVLSASPTLTGTVTAAAANFSGTVNHTGAFQISGTAQTFPTSGLIVGTTDTQTLTGKTISGASNTLSNIALTSIATIGANTFLGSLAGGVPAALTINGGASCTNALTYTNGVGFGCNSIAGTGTVTSAQIAAGQGIAVTGTCTITSAGVCTVAAALGVSTNTPRIVNTIATDTILTSDCGKTVQEGTGSTGQYVVVLPGVGGFDTKCIIAIYNGDTTNGKILSGFPTANFTWPTMLMPGQTVIVQIENSAWTVALNPGRWRGGQTFHISNSGSNSNDGLTTSTPFATKQFCATVAYDYLDTQQNSVTCLVPSGESSQEFVQVFYPLPTGGTLIFEGSGGQFNWAPANSGYALQFGDGALVGLQNVHFTGVGSTTPAGYVFGHNPGTLDVNTNVSADTGAVSGSVFSCDYQTHFNINNGITVINATGALGGFLYQGCQGSVWAINGLHTFTTNPSIGRFAEIITGTTMTFAGNVSFIGSNTTSVSLLSGNSVLNNFTGTTLPGGTPTPGTGGQYCTSQC